MVDKSILILYQVRSGNNIGPPILAGVIRSILVIVITFCNARIYSTELAIANLVAYLLSKL